MTARQMAEEFVKTMNPELVTDGSANFAIYEFKLPDKRFNLEIYFLEYDENEDDGMEFTTAVYLVDKCGYDIDDSFADTMTDIELIASRIDYLIQRYNVKT